MCFKQRNNAIPALYRVEQHPTLSLLPHRTISTMKAVCVALALAGSASAFVTPMPNVRATSTRYCRFLHPVLIRHVRILSSVRRKCIRGNARSAPDCVALLCCTDGLSDWLHRAFGPVPRNALFLVDPALRACTYVLFVEEPERMRAPGVFVRPSSPSHTLDPPGLSLIHI